MKDKVLQILRQTENYISGEELSRELGISRAGIWKVIQKLREEGYTIASAPNRGYRLEEATDRLCLQEILAQLPEDFPWRDRIQFFPVIDSTNNQAKIQAAAGALPGTVLVADRQDGGRGRRGRSFYSPSGMGIYLSMILRPGCPPDRLMHLTCAVAEAGCDAVEAATGFRPGIKWTNDLVWGKKKLSGILTELSLEAESATVQYAVVGIGINCCQQPEDLPEELRDMAASVSMAAGKPVNRNLLAARLIEALYRMDRDLLSGQKTIMDRYREDCITVGKEISLLLPCQTRHGTAESVADDGSLIVRFEDGHTEHVASGEVSIRGMYGYV